MAKSTARVSSSKGKKKDTMSNTDSFIDANPWLHKEFHLAKQVQSKEYLQADDLYSDMLRLAALFTGVMQVANSWKLAQYHDRTRCALPKHPAIIQIMAPKRDDKKRKPPCSPYSTRQVNMKLRSGCIPYKMLDQEASSRIRPLDTPLKRKNCISKRCVFIDDKAQVDENSNNIEDDTNFIETNVHVEDLHYNNEDDSDDSGQEEGDGGEEKKHSRHLGKQVSLGLMKDVQSQFYVKKQTLPPLVPLCRLVVHEAVRFARDGNEWLISSFDSFAYLETMGHFLVSVEDSRGDVMHVTATDLENWGPLWRQRNDEFERKLGKEWQELKNKKFLVWDGNQRLKTWWKRIKDKYVDNIEYHVSVRCQFLEVTKAKEAKLLLALDTSNAISRTHVTPNIAHEVYVFQKFGLTNKESILDQLTPDMREWAKVEMTVETRYYHGASPRYNTPCGLISQLVWKDEFNAFMSKEIAKVDALGLNDLERKKRLDKATKVEEQRLKDRGYKYLSIANPLNGDEFCKLLFGIKWDDPACMQAFTHLMDTVRSSDTSEKMPKLMFSAKRVIYRWIVQCVEEQVLDAKPMFTTEWINVGDENTMYSPSLVERRLTSWEANFCPRWLDYLVIVIPKQEIELRERFKKENNEYVEGVLEESVSQVSHEGTLVTIESGSQATPLANSALDKDKGPTEPPGTSTVPSTSSMPATTPSREPSTSSLPMASPSTTPSSMVVPTSSLMHTTSFVAESSLGRNNALDKDKGPTEPPGTSTVPSTSSMPTTTPSRAPSTSSLPVDSPSTTPSSMAVPTSSLMHTTSFVAESSLGREVWERMTITRSSGLQYQPVIDVLLVDV
ncbi:hypothetical protein L7F22_036439 [Adiantum nelumboides]|nr:hypothetical protein [Adiantum nelumboides]